MVSNVKIFISPDRIKSIFLSNILGFPFHRLLHNPKVSLPFLSEHITLPSQLNEIQHKLPPMRFLTHAVPLAGPNEAVSSLDNEYES